MIFLVFDYQDIGIRHFAYRMYEGMGENDAIKEFSEEMNADLDFIEQNTGVYSEYKGVTYDYQFMPRTIYPPVSVDIRW